MTKSFPNDVQKLYKDSNFGKCKNESFYFDTIEIIDDKTGEHLKRINLLEKVYKEKIFLYQPHYIYLNLKILDFLYTHMLKIL